MYDVNVIDDDIMMNGRVEFVIMYGEEGKFVINVIFGVIMIVGVFDWEKKDWYLVSNFF